MKQKIILIFFIALCLVAGGIGSIFTAGTIPTWYASLVKPSLNPPSWVFAPVWTTLYILMGVAMYLVFRQGWGRKDVRFALVFFTAHLVLNAGWSIIFFGGHNVSWALVAIIVLWLMIAFSIYLFRPINRTAAWLLVPYLLWVSFATYLNYSIWILNR